MEFESKDGFLTKYSVIHFFMLMALIISTMLTFEGITADYDNLENQNNNYFRLKKLYEKVKAENNISFTDSDENLELEKEIYYHETINQAHETSMSIELRFLLIILYIIAYGLFYRQMKRMKAKKDKTIHKNSAQ